MYDKSNGSLRRYIDCQISHKICFIRCMTSLARTCSGYLYLLLRATQNLISLSCIELHSQLYVGKVRTSPDHTIIFTGHSYFFWIRNGIFKIAPALVLTATIFFSDRASFCKHDACNFYWLNLLKFLHKVLNNSNVFRNAYGIFLQFQKNSDQVL